MLNSFSMNARFVKGGVKIMNKKIITTVALTLMLFTFGFLSSLSTTLARDVNVPSNVKIMYYTGGALVSATISILEMR